VTGFQTAFIANILLILRYSPRNSESQVHDNNSENYQAVFQIGIQVVKYRLCSC